LPQQEYTPNLPKKINATFPPALKGHFLLQTTSVVSISLSRRLQSLEEKLNGRFLSTKNTTPTNPTVVKILKRTFITIT
jgi:hypothetical protein